MPTKIEWCDETWNPIRGCSRISAGCGGPGKQGGCYAEKIAARFIGPGMAFEGYAKRVNGEARWTGKLGLIQDKLDEPLRWRKPRRIFVNSMSDLFHENLPDRDILNVFSVMENAPRHTFQILTKRADRMRAWVTEHAAWVERNAGVGEYLRRYGHVWLGVSVEDQERADERIPHLLQTPAAKRFISAEPLLGGIDLTHIDDGSAHREVPRKEWGSVDDEESPPGLWWDATTGKRTIMHGGATGDWSRTDASLDWVIVGGESGSRPREFDLQWARDLVGQCNGAGVACFVKQIGGWPVQNAENALPTVYPTNDRKGGDMAEWPADLRVREFPA